jgi:hypothetical protein
MYEVLLEELVAAQMIKKFPIFVDPEGSLPNSQQLSTGLYPAVAEISSFISQPISLRSFSTLPHFHPHLSL